MAATNQGEPCPIATAWTEVVRSLDPNEKSGPAGMGEQRVVSVGDDLHYTIYFENVRTATAPAQEVFVTDSLDPALDWSTFQITEIAFGERAIAVPDGMDGYYTRLSIPDYRTGKEQSWWVEILTEIDYQTGQARCTFRTLDPLTGELPADPLAGFLPPNDEAGRGEGHVAFSVKPRADTPIGTRVTNSASIVFDTNEAIETNEVWNTVGAGSRIFLPLVLRNG